MAVKGLDRLRRQLQALPKAQIAAARAALEQGAQEMATAIARAAPADRGDLSASIGWAHAGQAPKTSATQAIRPDASERRELLGAAGLSVEVYAGNNTAFYARWVEFGTAPGKIGERTGARNSDVKQAKNGRKVARTHPGTRAQPFFYPTVRALKKRMKSRMVRNANKAAKIAAAVK